MFFKTLDVLALSTTARLRIPIIFIIIFLSSLVKGAYVTKLNALQKNRF